MRTLVHTSLFGFLATSAVLLASSAYAQDGGTPDGGGGGLPNCDPTTLLCSNGLIASGHKAESMDRLPIGIDTGWIPECTSNPPHCDKTIQVRAQIAFDPPKTGGIIYSVDMTKDTFIDLHWDPSNTDTFTVSLAKGKAANPAGKFTVSHTLTPEFGIYVDTPVYTGEFNIDASLLINYIPGAQFNYYATGSAKFPPWGFDLVENQVKGTDVANSQLFSVTFEQLGKLVGTGNFNDYVEGQFSFNATTDSTFTYQTTKVVVTGADAPIGYQEGTAQYPINDGDAVDLLAHAEGVIRYTGKIDLKFIIGITSVAGFDITLNFPVDVYSYPYDSGAVQVAFPAQQVHIPIPNVFVPSTVLDFGTVQTGSKSGEKTIEIENSGELGAILEFSSDSNQFSVSSQSTTMGPDGDKYVLKVTFKPTKSGVQNGTITVKSNDPDSPVQTVQVRGIGEGQDLPDPEDGGTGGSGGGQNEGGAAETVYDPGSSNDGGCGCTTAPVAYGNAIAGLALAGLGLAMLRRKRS